MYLHWAAIANMRESLCLKRAIAIKIQVNQHDENANAKLVDTMLNMETVELYGNQNTEIKRYYGLLKEYQGSNIKLHWVWNVLNSGTD